MHKIVFIKKTLQELIRFLGTNICVLMVYKFCFLDLRRGPEDDNSTHALSFP